MSTSEYKNSNLIKNYETFLQNIPEHVVVNYEITELIIRFAMEKYFTILKEHFSHHLISFFWEQHE
jgi:hypothetical protein